MFNGQSIKLKPGQFITGRKALAECTGISESKCERLLKYFEIEQQIEQQKTNKFRIISICNWEQYQESEQLNEQQMNNKWTTNGQQVNTNNKDKKVKKDKKDIVNKKQFLDSVFLTDEQHQVLKNKYGNDILNECIEVLNNYKMSSGKRYKSDYHTIQGWVIRRVQDDKSAGIGSGINKGKRETFKTAGKAQSDGTEYPVDAEF